MPRPTIEYLKREYALYKDLKNSFTLKGEEVKISSYPKDDNRHNILEHIYNRKVLIGKILELEANGARPEETNKLYDNLASSDKFFSNISTEGRKNYSLFFNNEATDVKFSAGWQAYHMAFINLSNTSAVIDTRQSKEDLAKLNNGLKEFVTEKATIKEEYINEYKKFAAKHPGHTLQSIADITKTRKIVIADRERDISVNNEIIKRANNKLKTLNEDNKDIAKNIKIINTNIERETHNLNAYKRAAEKINTDMAELKKLETGLSYYSNIKANYTKELKQYREIESNLAVMFKTEASKPENTVLKELYDLMSIRNDLINKFDDAKDIFDSAEDVTAPANLSEEEKKLYTETYKIATAEDLENITVEELYNMLDKASDDAADKYSNTKSEAINRMSAGEKAFLNHLEKTQLECSQEIEKRETYLEELNTTGDNRLYKEQVSAYMAKLDSYVHGEFGEKGGSSLPAGQTETVNDLIKHVNETIAKYETEISNDNKLLKKEQGDLQHNNEEIEKQQKSIDDASKAIKETQEEIEDSKQAQAKLAPIIEDAKPVKDVAQKFINMRDRLFKNPPFIFTTSVIDRIKSTASVFLEQKNAFADGHKNSKEFSNMVKALEIVKSWPDCGDMTKDMKNPPESFTDAVKLLKDNAKAYSDAKAAQWRPKPSALRVKRLALVNSISAFAENSLEALDNLTVVKGKSLEENIELIGDVNKFYYTNKSCKLSSKTEVEAIKLQQRIEEPAKVELKENQAEVDYKEFDAVCEL